MVVPPRIQFEPECASKFCWESYVSCAVHPVKVEIVEAVTWIGIQPSLTELTRVLKAPGASNLAHHLRGLKDLGVWDAIGEGDEPFEWARLVPDVIHPAKVAIVEAMCWIDKPLSPREVDSVLDDRYGLSLVAYHMRSLAEAGAIRLVEQRQVRGALQNLYVLEPRGR